MTLRGQRKEIVHLPDGTVLTTNFTVWHNNAYAVAVYDPAYDGAPTQITVQRFDEQPARDLRHLQQIKDEVCGPEYEAVEIFPAQARVVDFTNTTHLWVFKEPLGFGMLPHLPAFGASFHDENSRTHTT